jgi:hypothetical protein
MITTKLSALVFAWLMTTHPPDKLAALPTFPEATETGEERTLRYQDIADDIAAVAAEVKGSDNAKKRAAALLFGIAWHESNFAKDVDLSSSAANCAPGRIAKRGCDGGRARSLWQIHTRFHPFETRREAARIALRLSRSSMRTCRAFPVETQLAVYAGRPCDSSEGQEKSREVFRLVERAIGIRRPAAEAERAP